ncbi:MAG TPA: hypothetical protein VLT16_11900, partial [Candidatus Limnocylindrales bacterium]|nr:hypothetical protein [Candidatus Limnocylindrales bacterium]
GLYQVQLIVNDGKVDSPPATVVITAVAPALQLTAPAPAVALPGQTATLDFTVANAGVVPAQSAALTQGAATVPIGTVAAGQTVPAPVSVSVPAIAAKGSTELDSAYLARLQASDNQSTSVPASLTWSDLGGVAFGPVSAATSVTEQLPIINVVLDAPPVAQAATTINYTVTVTNLGHADGTISGLLLTLPDGTTQTPALPQTTLAPGTSASVTVPFAVPVSQTGTISAFVHVSWQDANINSYGPLSSTAVTEINGVSPPVLASCAPSGSISVLLQNGNVTSYVPNGSWSTGATGIRVVPVEGTGALGLVATTGAVNSCSSNSVTGQTVCTANNTDVYLLSGTALTTTLKSGSTGTAAFSGGTCQTCGVAVNAATNQAVLTVGLAGSTTGGIQVLDLATNVFSPPVPTSGVRISEDISIDPIRSLILSASESSAFEIFQQGAGGTSVFDQAITPTHAFDATTEDCTTGIAVASVEGGSGLFLSDLTQAAFSAGPPATWSGPGQFQAISELGGMDGIAVAPGSQFGVAAEEFGDNRVGVFRLPATSGSGIPAAQDWAQAIIPNPGEPNGSTRFFTGGDPHTITAYTSPNDGKAYGVIADGGPFFLAVVDLAGLLALPRNPISPHLVDSTIDLVANGVIRFVPVSTFLKFPASPNSGQQGAQNLAVEIKGAATHFVQGVTTVGLGAGISVASVTVNSAADLTAIVNIDPTATVGQRVVSVTTGAEALTTINGGFNVTQGPAAISQISPSSAVQGQTVTVTITGSATHFAQGVTTVNFGFSTAASTVTGVTVNSPTSITATLNISPLESASLHNVQITTGGEIARGTFTVVRGPAVLTNISPNSGSQGRQHLTLTITGQSTHFAQGLTVLSSDFT